MSILVIVARRHLPRRMLVINERRRVVFGSLQPNSAGAHQISRHPRICKPASHKYHGIALIFGEVGGGHRTGNSEGWLLCLQG